MSHIPVLLDDVLTGLAPQPGNTVLDGTLGRGGHAAALAARIGAKGHLVACDRDPAALEGSRALLEASGTPCTLIHSPFSCVFDQLSPEWRFDAVLLDLGVSSPQLDTPDRGFSFMQNGPLDMRMDPTCGPSAREYVAQLSETELADVIYRYGEERFSRKIAKSITERRRKAPINTTEDLATLVRQTIMGHSPIDKATRTFQALRILVNDELGELERFLDKIPSVMRPGGRLGIISFHSLEDRIVKLRFRDWKQDKIGHVLTKKPIIASEQESWRNARARSAKLRIIEFLEPEKSEDS